MNKIIIFLIIIGCNGIFAQLSKHNFHIYVHGGYGAVGTSKHCPDKGSTYSLLGLRTEILASKRLGLNYNFDYQMRRDSINQFHSTMGVVGAPFFMGFGIYKGFDGDTTTKGIGTFLLGLALLVLPDGISLHYSPAPNWDIAPTVNILGLDFIKDRTTEEFYLKYACSFGIKTSYVLQDKFALSSYVETRQAAGFGWGINAGVGAGILLGRKK